jgi:hypothetical protein
VSAEHMAPKILTSFEINISENAIYLSRSFTMKRSLL